MGCLSGLDIVNGMLLLGGLLTDLGDCLIDLTSHWD